MSTYSTTYASLALSAMLALGSHAETSAPRAFRLTGVVVDAEGHPVTGALVEQYESSGLPFPGSDSELKQRFTTGADGTFEFALSRVPTQVIARKTGMPPAWNYYAKPAGDLADERLVFATSSSLGGVVVDEADMPVADAEVWVSTAYAEMPSDNDTRSHALLTGQAARLAFSTHTTADGKFRLEGFPSNASADLAVKKPGKVLREVRREHVRPLAIFQAGQEDIQLVVEPAGSIEGKVVVEETGQPLPDARFSLQFNRPGYGTVPENDPARSAADGTFRVSDVVPGSYLLRATFGAGTVPDWVADTVPVTVEAGKTTGDVKVSAVKGGFLKVAALAKRGWTPLENASIRALRGAFSASGSADSNGVALFRLPPGEYRVFASIANAVAHGYSTTVESGQTNRVEIELIPPPSITGVVLDPSGKPAPGLKVSLASAFNSGAPEVRTDASGRYELPWSGQRFPGRETAPCLIVRDPARNLAVAEEIEEGATSLDLHLKAGLVLTGRVEDPGGKPLANASVQVFVQSANMTSPLDDRPVKTDAEGRFEIKCLPAGGQYTLWANAKGHGSAYQTVEREDSETNLVELSAFVLQVADQALAGQVLDADDKPVAGAQVYMFGQGQANNSTRSDPQGRFKFNEVCAGEIHVSAHFQNATGNAQAQAGDTNVVIHLGANDAFALRYGGSPANPKRALLKGRPLPDLTVANLAAEAVPAGKPVLLCLFDVEQRPSRRFISSLREQHEALKEKGVTVLGLQAAVITPDAFKEWKDANPVPFPVGHLAEKSDKLSWASELDSLPWLILTDKEHRVTAEGFSLDELEPLLKAASK